MKQIEVVAAILHDAEGRIFATQRGYGEWKDYWEFPGGKIEAEETRIVIEHLVTTVDYDYPKFHLTMHCFWCHVESGSLTLTEHEAARWLAKDELDSVGWLPADAGLIEQLKTML